LSEPQHLPRRDWRIVEAGKWIDASLANKQKMTETIADKVMSTPAWTLYQPAHSGVTERHGQNLGRPQLHGDDGAVNFPYLSDGMWFRAPAQALGPDGITLTIWPWPNRSTRSTSTNKLPQLRQGRGAKRRDAQQQVVGVVWDGRPKYAESFKIRVIKALANRNQLSKGDAMVSAVFTTRPANRCCPQRPAREANNLLNRCERPLDGRYSLNSMKKSNIGCTAGCSNIDAILVYRLSGRYGCTLLGMGFAGIERRSWCRWAPKPASTHQEHLHQAVHHFSDRST
jgi:hypothetical protein